MRMRTCLSLAAVALAACALPAAAKSPPEAAKTPRACFWTNQVTNFASDDDRVVHLRVGVKEVWRLEMLGRCTDIDWSDRIAIRSRGSSHICSGLDAEIIAPSSIGPQRCAVKTVRKLTPDEVKALPKRARP